MNTLLLTFIQLFFNLFKSKKSLICENVMLKQELQILHRKVKAKRSTTHQDRIFFAILNLIDHISIVKPKTVLRWQRMIIKSNWTFNSGNKKRGRKAIAFDIKKLILKIKNDNIFMGSQNDSG